MRTILRTALVALLLLAAPALSLGAAHASPAAEAAQTAAASPTPSPGDTASTGPANPGTGESAQNESTRTDNTPWVIGGIILVTLIAILVWRRLRGNKTIV